MRLALLFSALWLHACCRCGRLSWPPLCKPCQSHLPLRLKTDGDLTVYALGPFRDPLREAVTRFKYQQETAFAARLGGAMARTVPPEWRGATLVPVPLHPTRLASRGYNQSALLARIVARELSMSLRLDWLRRCVATAPQARLARAQRVRNMQGAFAFDGPRAISASVVLVDDVVTTGQTMDACAGALVQAGVRVLGGLGICAATRAAPGVIEDVDAGGAPAGVMSRAKIR